MRTRVAIIGAGPAGLSLARMLARQGIDSEIIEIRSEAHVRARLRAGVIEQTTVDLLTDLGAADRLHREALRHSGFYLRFDGITHHLDFAADTGRHAFVYGQNELVADLIDLRTGDGNPIRFDCSEVSIADVDSARPRVDFRREGVARHITADFIVGADGFHGVCRTLLPTSATASRSYPAAWLGILARTPSVTDEGMYCASPRGLSVHSMRGRELTRQYLQVPADTSLEEWPDERIWQELKLRSASLDHPELATGEIIERSLAPLRSVVTEPMQRGSMFLLGDAAHIVPPTGAKGLNLALSDACVLSHALGSWYRDGDRAPLAGYTATALPRVWQAQAFAWELTTTLHRFSDDPFEWPLRRARLQRWATSPAERTALGERYLGLPLPTPWRPDGLPPATPRAASTPDPEQPVVRRAAPVRTET